MKTVSYDAFATARVRYPDDSCEDIAILQDTHYGVDDWWQGSWESWTTNMIKACVDSGDIKEDWVSMMIAFIDWEDENCVFHHIHVVQGEPDITHEWTTFNE